MVFSTSTSPESPCVMSGPSLHLGQKVLKEKQEEDSVQNEGNIDLKTSIGNTSGGRGAPAFVSSIRKDEPIVTRRELWSYYC